MSTLAQLITQVRDEISEPTPGFVSDVEVTRWLNRANYDMAIAAMIEAAPSSTITTADGTEAYSFPSDFGQVEQVEIVDSGDPNSFCVLTPVTIEQRVTGKSKPQGYYVYAGQLYLVPKPDGVYTIRLWYYKQGITLAANGDIPIIPTIFHDYLAFFAISQAKRKGDDPAYLTYLQDYITGREDLQAFVRQRSLGNHFAMVEDTDDR